MTTIVSRRIAFVGLAPLMVLGPTVAEAAWYWLVPPGKMDSKGNLVSMNKKAPIRDWTIIDSFDSKQQCMNAIRNVQDVRKRLPGRDNKTSLLVDERMALSECLAGDDPRLR